MNETTPKEENMIALLAIYRIIYNKNTNKKCTQAYQHSTICTKLKTMSKPEQQMTLKTKMNSNEKQQQHWQLVKLYHQQQRHHIILA